MKKILIFLLCIATAISFAACGTNNAVTGSDSSVASSTDGGLGNTQIPNPIVDYDTLEDAVGRIGFDFTVPDAIGEYDDRTIQVIGNELIQAIYRKGDDQINVRKAAGSDDISGDYTDYAEINTVSVGNLQVTMKGTGGTVNVAVWTESGYSYSVHTVSGLSSTAMSDLIASIH